MNTVYPLFPISILVILFYSLSFAFSRMGLVSRSNHRKFWNVLLLIAFLISGLIGLLMVVKTNYKLVIPFYDQLVGYHVGFGIGMAFIGFFHLWWHLKYYLGLFKGEKSNGSRQRIPMENDTDERFLKISAFLLGSTSIIAQVILLREFMAVFNGNELVIGLVLANWMILTGLGAFLGKFPLKIKKAFSVIVSGLLILSVLPFKDTLNKMTGKNLNVFATDPMRFIRNTTTSYDVAILNLPGPSTMQSNRFYTLEFYRLLKQKLNPGAVFSFGIQAPPNYLNPEAVNLNSTLYATLKKMFQNVLIIPGEKNYFPAEINQNLKPVSYHHQLAYWLSQFKGKYWIMAVFAAALSLFVFFRGNTAQFTQASLNRTGSYADISGKTYSYDLFGSALGALAVTLYLVPKLGIVVSVLTLSLLNLVFGIWLFRKR